MQFGNESDDRNVAQDRASFPPGYIQVMISLAVFVIFLLAIAAFIWRQNQIKGRFGIGSLRGSCPRCGAPLPTFRKPASASEIIGGWTCPQCGRKIDKYAREIRTG